MGIDSVALRELYATNEDARAVLDHFASRERNWSQTTVDRLQANLRTADYDLSRGAVISIFRELERCGCGDFVIGRKGHQSRFEWSTGMVSVGRAASGETEQVEDVEPEDDGEEADEAILQHTYRLRPDVVIRLELPRNFAVHEAKRLSDHILTLPFENSAR